MVRRCFRANVNSENGFTLIEVLVVLMILGFLAAIAFPQFSKVIGNSQERADEASIQIIESAIEVYHIDQGKYPDATDFDGLIAELKGKEYIRQEKIESADSKNFEFDYNTTNHSVTRIAK